MTRALWVPRRGAVPGALLVAVALALVAAPAQAPIDATGTDCDSETLDVTFEEPASPTFVSGFVDINWTKDGTEASTATSDLYYQHDGENVSIASDLINTSYTWDTSNVDDADGYTFVVDAKTLTCHDVAETSTFAIDNSAPSTSASAPTAGSLWTGAVEVTWTTDDARPDTVEVEHSSDDGASWAQVATVDDDGQATIDTSMLGDGTEHRLRMTPIDAAGNVGPSVTTGSFAVDDTAPTVTLSSPADGATVTGNVEVTWTTDDAHPGCVDVQLASGGSWTTHADCVADDGSTSLDTTLLADGDLDLRIRAVDEAGHAGTSATASLTVDNAPVSDGGDDDGGTDDGPSDDDPSEAPGKDDPASEDGDDPPTQTDLGGPVTFSRAEGVVRQVRVVPADDVADVTVDVRNVDDFSEEVGALPDDVVALHRFTVDATAGGEPVAVSEAAITLTVPADAVDAGENPTLYHWNGTTWASFPVEEVAREDGHVTYNATVDGLSPFALGVHASPVDASLASLGVVLVAVGVVVAGALVAVYLRD